MGYMGNSGPSKDERYERYALAFYPANVEFDLLLAKVGAVAAFKSLANDLLQPAEIVDAGKLFEQFSRAMNVWNPAIIADSKLNYQSMFNRTKNPHFQSISDAVSIACRLDNIDLALRILVKVVGILRTPLALFLPLLEKYGWVGLVENLLPLLTGMSMSDALNIACHLDNIDLANCVLDKIVDVFASLDPFIPLVEKYGWINVANKLLRLIKGMEHRLELVMLVYEQNWEVCDNLTLILAIRPNQQLDNRLLPARQTVSGVYLVSF
jgi:hypothetical protein